MGRHSKPEGLRSFHDFSSIRVDAEGLGTSAALGSMAVPPGWPVPSPSSEPPSPPGTPRWHTFEEGLMGMMSGGPAIADVDTGEGGLQARGD
jgi:hypothetical protein